MAVEDPEITKLAGYAHRSGSMGLGTRAALMMAPDHLLLVESNGWSENYRRFYFREIQGFVLRRTPRRAVGNVILGSLTGLTFAICVLVSSAELGGFMAGAIMSMPFWLPLIVNSARGPACVCHVRTAVQMEEIPPLNRVLRARRVIAELTPRIEAAQGRANAEEIRDRVAEAMAAGPLESADPGADLPSPLSSLSPETPRIRRYESNSHAALFPLLLLAAGVEALAYLTGLVPLRVLSIFLFFLLLATTISALVKQRGTDLDPSVQRLTWVALVYLGVSGTISMAIMWSAFVEAIDSGPSAKEPGPLQLIRVVADAGFAACLGALGVGRLLAFNRERRERERVAPSESGGIGGSQV